MGRSILSKRKNMCIDLTAGEKVGVLEGVFKEVREGECSRS